MSQWRAYAQDGRGYAVGFNAKALTQLPVRPLQVLYELDRQVKEVKTSILAMQEVESTIDQPRSEEWFQACAALAFDLVGLKSSAFSEEKEVRMVHLINLQTSNSSLRLIDAGGTCLGGEASPQPIAFHIRNGIPAPHIDIDYTAGGSLAPICDVITGPRNNGLLSGISVFLETVGLPNVRLRHSQAPYR